MPPTIHGHQETISQPGQRHKICHESDCHTIWRFSPNRALIYRGFAWHILVFLLFFLMHSKSSHSCIFHLHFSFANTVFTTQPRNQAPQLCCIQRRYQSLSRILDGAVHCIIALQFLLGCVDGLGSRKAKICPFGTSAHVSQQILLLRRDGGGLGSEVYVGPISNPPSIRCLV